MEASIDTLVVLSFESKSTVWHGSQGILYRVCAFFYGIENWDAPTQYPSHRKIYLNDINSVIFWFTDVPKRRSFTSSCVSDAVWQKLIICQCFNENLVEFFGRKGGIQLYVWNAVKILRGRKSQQIHEKKPRQPFLKWTIAKLLLRGSTN